VCVPVVRYEQAASKNNDQSHPPTVRVQLPQGQTRRICNEAIRENCQTEEGDRATGAPADTFLATYAGEWAKAQPAKEETERIEKKPKQ